VDTGRVFVPSQVSLDDHLRRKARWDRQPECHAPIGDDADGSYGSGRPEPNQGVEGRPSTSELRYDEHMNDERQHEELRQGSATRPRPTIMPSGYSIPRPIPGVTSSADRGGGVRIAPAALRAVRRRCKDRTLRSTDDVRRHTATDGSIRLWQSVDRDHRGELQHAPSVGAQVRFVHRLRVHSQRARRKRVNSTEQLRAMRASTSG